MRVILIASFVAVLANLAAPGKSYAQGSAGTARLEPEQVSQTTGATGGSAPSSGQLATQATNPAAALIQLQLQNQFIPNTNNASGSANTFILQPVIPISLGEDSYFQDIVTRWTLPLVTTSDPDGPVDDTTDLGDLTVLAFPVHKEKVSDSLGFQWGPGLAAIAPTATDDRTGTDKWSLGPGLLGIGSTSGVFEGGDSLLFGAYGYNVWSVAGDDDRADVNKLYAAPVVVYHFAELAGQDGWYAGYTDELWSFDWEDDGDAGTSSMPIGARLGRVFNIGAQPINVFLQSDYWLVDRRNDPIWDIKLNVTFLFPE